MKSAYELAMERLGGSREYTAEQKEQLAEIDRTYEARKAQTRLRIEDELKKIPHDPDRQNDLHEELSRELQKLDEKKEREKDKVRDGGT